MTDREELEKLMIQACTKGANITVERDTTGYPTTITVSGGLKGVGPCPMSPIYFAEKMREVLR